MKDKANNVRFMAVGCNTPWGGLQIAKVQEGVPMSQNIKLIPRETWGPFLESFGRLHHGWATWLETKDHVTKEDVVTPASALEAMELDLEDEKNPRINVSVKLDNKFVKHILFRPSQVVRRTRDGADEESLEIETLNTKTTVYVRPSPLVE